MFCWTDFNFIQFTSNIRHIKFSQLVCGEQYKTENIQFMGRRSKISGLFIIEHL